MTRPTLAEMGPWGAADPRVRDFIHRIYHEYHRPDFIAPDPLELVLPWERTEDREIVALLASSLALGRVGGILRAAAQVIALLGDRPREALEALSPGEIRHGLVGFRYRFFGPSEMASFLLAIRKAILDAGSLEALFTAGLGKDDETVVPALGKFSEELHRRAPGDWGILLCDPRRGSASKRLNLFLRWMVRKDAVDPGGWSSVPPAKLLVPLDTHMHSLGRHLGLIKRPAADLTSALEMTSQLGLLDQEDPVRFDFSLCRLGIHRKVKKTENFSGYYRKTLS